MVALEKRVRAGEKELADALAPTWRVQLRTMSGVRMQVLQ